MAVQQQRRFDAPSSKKRYVGTAFTPCRRRELYRKAKRLLYGSLRRFWRGSDASLRKRIRTYLRDKPTAWLRRALARPARAAALVVAAGFCSNAEAIELADIALDNNTGGFVINGVDPDDRSGGSVSGAGDVNGDGLADLIVGAYRADPGGNASAGESYVVFGKPDGTAVELSAVAVGAGGFVINGIDAGDYSGRSISGTGDVNGDGLDDLILGVGNADPGGDLSAGQSYVVFGKPDGTAVELSNIIAGSGGFVINGIDPNDRSGWSVSGAGDVNGDGLADLIVGAPGADPGGNSAAGESYVVFGKPNGTAVELSNIIAGSGGFVINGIDPDDFSGGSVSGAGDVNGDGLADVIVGAQGADPAGDSFAGESYVIFGKPDGTAVELSDIASGVGGFVINGIDPDDFSGGSVSGAGDVNGDGLADVIVGAQGADPGSNLHAGESYVVFGKADNTAVELSDVASGVGGFVIDGIDASDYSGRSVSGAGDVNGDGLADLIIGASQADPDGDSFAGESYVVFGKVDTTPVELSTVAAGTGGFVINGIDAGDFSGVSVSGAGDVNGDGLPDLIVGAWAADPGGRGAAGESYVVFGPTPDAVPTGGAYGSAILLLILAGAGLTTLLRMKNFHASDPLAEETRSKRFRPKNKAD